MPAIEKYPTASLHIYCRKDQLSKFAETKILELSEYVQNFNRVDQNVLARAYNEADVWLYPTKFPETYCITALEAQMAKCLCVCTKLAGLINTVGDRGILINECDDTSKYDAILLKELFEILDDKKKR